MASDRRNIGSAELATRFKKGASGNPRGRAKKKVSDGSDPLESIWDRIIAAPVNGRKRRMSYRAVCVKQKVGPCIQGDLDAIEGLLALRRNVDGKPPRRATRVIIQNEDGTYDE